MSNSNHPTRVVCPQADLPASIDVDDASQVHSCSRLLPGTTCNVECNLQLRYTALDLDAFLQKHGQQPCSRCHRPITAEDWYDSRLTGRKFVLDSTSETQPSGVEPGLCWLCFVLRSAAATRRYQPPAK